MVWIFLFLYQNEHSLCEYYATGVRKTGLSTETDIHKIILWIIQKIIIKKIFMVKYWISWYMWSVLMVSTHAHPSPSWWESTTRHKFTELVIERMCIFLAGLLSKTWIVFSSSQCPKQMVCVCVCVRVEAVKKKS